MPQDPQLSFHPNIAAAAQAAVADGRIRQEHLDYLNAFMANPGAFSLGNIFTIILPILSAIFPQFAPIIAIIQQIFGGGTPTPAPSPGPSPAPAPSPSGFFAQIWAFLKAFFNNGNLPVPGPKPAPAPSPLPTGIVPPTPVP